MKIKQNIKIALTAVAILWFVFFLDQIFSIDLRLYGIRPRSIEGLWGIVFSPFLHANISHLLANSGAILILLWISFSFNRKFTLFALLIIIFAGGGLVWIFGSSNTVHVGASGVIFGLIGFLLSVGIFHRNWKALLFSAVVLFFYGAAVFSLFRHEPGISWTGHFFGFLSGIFAAWITKPQNKS